MKTKKEEAVALLQDIITAASEKARADALGIKSSWVGSPRGYSLEALKRSLLNLFDNRTTSDDT